MLASKALAGLTRFNSGPLSQGGHHPSGTSDLSLTACCLTAACIPSCESVRFTLWRLQPGLPLFIHARNKKHFTCLCTLPVSGV